MRFYGGLSNRRRPPKNFDAALNNIGSHDLAIYSRTDFLRMSFFSPNVSYCSAMLVVVGFGFVSVVNQRLCWLKSGTSSNIGCRLVILLNPAYRSLEHFSWKIYRNGIQSSNMDCLIHTYKSIQLLWIRVGVYIVVCRTREEKSWWEVSAPNFVIELGKHTLCVLNLLLCLVKFLLYTTAFRSATLVLLA